MRIYTTFMSPLTVLNELPTGEKYCAYLFDTDWEWLIISGHGNSRQARKVMFTLTDEIKTLTSGTFHTNKQKMHS